MDGLSNCFQDFGTVVLDDTGICLQGFKLESSIQLCGFFTKRMASA